MGDESRSEYQDSRARALGLAVHRQQQEQSANLRRVSGRIGPAVIEFFSVFDGMQFNSGTLHAWVEAKCGRIAPGSADRVMRDLAERGEVSYQVINRAQSLYRAGASRESATC